LTTKSGRYREKPCVRCGDRFGPHYDPDQRAWDLATWETWHWCSRDCEVSDKILAPARYERFAGEALRTLVTPAVPLLGSA
jgi:hypothetical protein